MIKSEFAKAFVLGICITAFSTSIAFANTEGVQSSIDRPMSGQYVVSQPGEIPQSILEEQAKIDQYVFIEHRKEIEEMGFMVTHTGPMKDYVEVGIAPYNEDNANYLYKVFGKDKLKVVEGEQVVTFNGPATSSINPLLAPDTPVSSPASGTPNISIDSKPSGEIASAEIASAEITITSNAVDSSKQTTTSSSPSPIIYGTGIAAVLGAIALATRKLIIAKR